MAGSNQDQTEVRKGRVRRAYGEWREKRRIKKQVDEQKAKLEATKIVEGIVAGSSSAQSSMPSEGGDSGLFVNFLKEAIRRGYTMTKGGDTSNIEIRDVVCSEQFLRTIEAQDSSLTPIEADDETYEEYMRDKRAKLVEKLRSGRIVDLNGPEMDVIITCMIGKRYTEGEQGQITEFWAGWDEKNRDGETLARPSDAFFRLLENYATWKQKDKEGAFIGGALAGLKDQKSVAGLAGGNVPIIDPRYVDEYLAKKCAAPLEGTIAEFARLIREVMNTPTTEMHEELGTPGLGIPQKLEREAQRLQHAEEELGRLGRYLDQLSQQEPSTQEELQQLQVEIKRAMDASSEARRSYDDARESVKDLQTKARVLEERFRLVLNEGEMSTVAQTSKKWFPNETIEDLLGDARKVIEEYATLAAMEKRDSASFRARAERMAQKAAELEQKVAAAELPVQTKQAIQRIVDTMKDQDHAAPKEVLEGLMEIVREDHAYPVEKAAEKAVKKLKEGAYDRAEEIAHEQWIIAHNIWEKSEVIEKPGDIQREGRLARWNQRFNHRFLTAAGWKGMGEWLLKYSTFRMLGRNIRYGYKPVKNRIPGKGIDPDAPIIRPFGLFTLRRGHYALLHAAVLGYLGYSIYPAWAKSPSMWEHYTAPVAAETNWAVDGSGRWWQPQTWWYPVEKRKTYTRVIEDPYDIPERLSQRGREYYCVAYGVCEEPHLEWLEDKKEVLRYFQERRSLVKVLDWTDLKREPETCSTRKYHIPPTCQNLGLKTDDDINAYSGGRVDTEDGWEPNADLKVCCLIELKIKAVEDGLRLNRHMADAFVGYLMVQEEQGAPVNYEYLDTTQNRMRWVESRYLINKDQDEVMTKYGVSSNENLDFGVVQKAHLEELAAAYVVVGDAQWYIEEGSRDAFFDEWRKRIEKKTGSDPVKISNLSEADVKAAFDETLEEAKKKKWVSDKSSEYREKKLTGEFEKLGLKLQESKDIYVAQEDIRTLLQKFLPAKAAYTVNKGRSDELIGFLARQKQNGVPIADFDIFEGGSRSEGLVTAGYVTDAQVFSGTGVMPDGTPDPKVVREKSQQFYAKNGEFKVLVESTIDQLYDDKGSDGKVMAAAFAGNKDKTKEHVMEQIYLAATKPIDQKFLGLKVAEEGDPPKVSFDSAKITRNALKSKIIQILKVN